MSGVRLPPGWRIEPLRRERRRRKFHSGEARVDQWLATSALQHQEKHLSVTKVLLDDNGAIAGYYTLATGQVDFGELPVEVVKRLPQRILPVAALAWLGVDSQYQGRGIGRLLLAQSLRDCWEAGKTFAFVAVILDCINDDAKSFYEHWDFQGLPGHPYRLFLSAKRLKAMIGE
jgi:GNAT superfamily N-acetyltransferase